MPDLADVHPSESPAKGQRLKIHESDCALKAVTGGAVMQCFPSSGIQLAYFLDLRQKED